MSVDATTMGRMHERAVADHFRRAGWLVGENPYHSGAVDLFLFHPETKEFRLIDVKTYGACTSRQQSQMVEVEVVYYNTDTREVIDGFSPSKRVLDMAEKLEKALDMRRDGIRDAEIARRLGINKGTIINRLGLRGPYKANLTDEQVIEIRRRYSLTPRQPAREIAEEFGVNTACVHNIWGGRSWKHLLP